MPVVGLTGPCAACLWPTTGQRARASAGPPLTPEVRSEAGACALRVPSTRWASPPCTRDCQELACGAAKLPGILLTRATRAGRAPCLCSLDMSASKSENGDAHRLDPELAVRLAPAPSAVTHPAPAVTHPAADPSRQSLAGAVVEVAAALPGRGGPSSLLRAAGRAGWRRSMGCVVQGLARADARCCHHALPLPAQPLVAEDKAELQSELLEEYKAGREGRAWTLQARAAAGGAGGWGLGGSSASGCC